MKMITFAIVVMGLVFAAQVRATTISGTVLESGSKEVVVGATVALHRDSLVPGRRPVRGAYTNRYGFFSIGDVAPGTYAVVVTSVGYTPYVSAVVVREGGDAITLDIRMEPRGVRKQEVVVTAERSSTALERQSVITIAPSFIKEMPAIGGEVDVFRVLQLLPGVKSASELSAGLYIRGGSPDQNLVLLDGVTVYNPSHLGGFLSSFHADALRDVKLMKGAFPAEYGGRLSSVIDITMKEGNAERIKGSGSVSLIASGLQIDGPIDSTTTFMVSGRRFYLDLLIGLATLGMDNNEFIPQYYFYDLNMKLNKRLGQNDRLFLSGYFGRDVLTSGSDTTGAFDIGWGNSTANLRWAHIINPEMFTSTSLIYTDYIFGTELSSRDFQTGREASFGVRSRIRDLTFRSELQWSAAADHLVKTGVDVTRHNFLSSVGGSLIEIDTSFIRAGDIISVDAALYAQDEWTITDALRANLGGRLYWFQQGGWVRFEPRASMSYDLTETSSLTGSFAVAHQFLHLIVRNDVSLPTDVWFPSTSKIEPSRSVQGVLGYQTTLDENAWRFTAETYYKTMENLYEYRDDAEFTLGVPLESQFTSGSGRAYGLELFLQRQLGDLTGWIGYTLAWTERTFPQLNGGKTFTPRYDRRHDVSIALQYRIGKTWRLGATWQYATGAAYTVPSAQYVTGNPEWGNTQDFFTERNAFRIAPFHKMDVNLINEFTMFDLPWEFSINVYNVYNRRNPFALYTTMERDNESGDYVKKFKQVTLFPIIPTLGLRFSF
jgi:hypothetical protein